jgi:hypothetical protein
MDLINCLIILQNNNYALWDLKLQNIGYGNNYNCVIIDYDEHTILPINKSSSANTYYPTYVYINYLSFKNKYNDNTFINNINLNKIPVAGLADVILGLFFKIKQNEEITSASLYNLHEGGTFKSAYSNNSSTFHIYSTNPNKANWWTESFLNLVNGKKIQEYLSLLSVNNAWENQHTKLINILFNYEYYTGLLSPEYSKIPTFEEVRRELYDSSTYFIPMEIDKFDMVGGSNIAYKKKYEKYLNQNKNLIDEINNNI